MSARRVLLIGAGRAGVMVGKEISQRPELALQPVGFVDDDPNKAHRRIGGLDVLGTTDDLAMLARTTGATEAILTMASVERADIRRIVHACEAAGLDTQIIPGLFEIVGGQVNVSRIRPVSVEDLLGRDLVELDPTSLHDLLGARTVMVTGAGGSIGSELARQAARFGPSRIVLVERSEPALWAVHRSLVAEFPALRVDACIADVTDRARMRALFEQHHPEVVAHAAAHKHVPMMEEHPGEAVKNNVGGTRIVVDLAAEYRVHRFVLVSTDKAVNPTSVMGATKRITERYVQHVAATTGLNFVAVRFGNVLGSAGSVVPVFEQQVREGGPVTVTHPDMVRYFMTIPEASGLVLQAAALGSPGEILVLDMGEPVKHRRPGRERHPPVRLRTGAGHRRRVHRPAPGREAVRGAQPVRGERHPDAPPEGVDRHQRRAALGQRRPGRRGDPARRRRGTAGRRPRDDQAPGARVHARGQRRHHPRPGPRPHVDVRDDLVRGQPAVTDPLPPIRIFLSPPDVGPRERELLLDAFDSNWIAPLGPHVDAFEAEMAETSAAACTRWRCPAGPRRCTWRWSTSGSGPATRSSPPR